MTEETWLYNGKAITEDDIPSDAVGFLYVIRSLKDNRKYLGKKLLTKAATKTVNGKKKKVRKDSDWKNYWSSSPWLIEILETEGRENFQRKILCFAKSRGELNYFEENAQYQLRVLEKDDWLNSNIRSRIFKKNVAKYDLKDYYRSLMVYRDCC